MARLTNDLRREITAKLMDRAFGEREKELAETRLKLGDAIYNYIYSCDMQLAMRRLPEGFFSQAQTLSIKYGAGETYVANWGDLRPVAFDHRLYYAENPAHIPPDHFLSNEILLFQIAQETYKNEWHCRACEIRDILNRVTTTNALKDIWPECAAIVDECTPKPKKKDNLPAVPDELNKLCKLPPTEIN